MRGAAEVLQLQGSSEPAPVTQQLGHKAQKRSWDILTWEDILHLIFPGSHRYESFCEFLWVPLNRFSVVSEPPLLGAVRCLTPEAASRGGRRRACVVVQLLSPSLSPMQRRPKTRLCQEA